MWTLGPLGFAAPLALFGLLTLPILWRLLRATPPPPKRAIFPPLRLLRDAPDDTETPHHAPWWLIVFRLLLATLIIIALARPVWQPEPDNLAPRPLLLVVDNGWASNPSWDAIQREAERHINRADSAGQPAALVLTADLGTDEIRLDDPDMARRRLEAAVIRAWSPDRTNTASRLAAADFPGALDVVWISDGLRTDGVTELAETLSDLGRVIAIRPDAGGAAMALTPPEVTPEGFAINVLRSEDSLPRTVTVQATSEDGRAVARADAVFAAGQRDVRTTIELPLELRNRVSAIRILEQTSAGAVQLTDDAWRRPTVGILDAASEDGQPLLSELHYVTRALEPFAELQRANLDTLMETPPAIIVMVDAARTDDPRLADFVDQGGVLIRFAGPRLAARGDELLPIPLREGGRMFGGALAWDEPQRLAPFSPTSPFAGLEADPEAVVRSQVLAEPGTATDDRVWARLEDGTPLVTSARRGRGWVVLFHVTAGPEWSDLPLTGLFPRMLRRTLSLSSGGAPSTAQGGSYAIDRAIDGRGRLSDPPASARPIPAQLFEQARASAETPPGLYRAGTVSAALNVMRTGDGLRALPAEIGGVRFANLDAPRQTPLAGVLLAVALILLALDALIALALAGRLAMPRFARGGTVAALAVLVLLPALAPRAEAQDTDIQFAMEASLDLRFAYVRTGNAEIDNRSRAGLTGLSQQAMRRSAIEPIEPMAVDIESDELVFFPMIYWPVREDAPALSPEAAARVTAYMQSGGLIVFDTQDADTAALRAGRPHPGLVRVLESVDVPSLAQMPADHVLTRSFYLLDTYPGRFQGGPVWVEADPDGAARDGTSGVVIGSNDWASAWAVGPNGEALYPVDGGDRQRELAQRFGVNLAMYALTGNYKADQVHVPALLERLGQ